MAAESREQDERAGLAGRPTRSRGREMGLEVGIVPGSHKSFLFLGLDTRRGQNGPMAGRVLHGVAALGLTASIAAFGRNRSRQSADRSRQKAVGSQQSADGSQQRAVGRRQSAGGSRQTAVSSRQSAVGSEEQEASFWRSSSALSSSTLLLRGGHSFQRTEIPDMCSPESRPAGSA